MDAQATVNYLATSNTFDIFVTYQGINIINVFGLRCPDFLSSVNSLSATVGGTASSLLSPPGWPSKRLEVHLTHMSSRVGMGLSVGGEVWLSGVGATLTSLCNAAAAVRIQTRN